ncbi:MAG: hypothetical protein WC782_12320 [Methylococcaceae bacterium]|jgi:hypothetical protein
MNLLISKVLRGLCVVLEINFCMSVVVLMTGCILSISNQHSIFNFDEELYGPLASSLRLMMVYLGIAELLICCYCFFSKKNQLFMVVGAFLILMIGSLEFYGRVNNVEIDADLIPFLLYTGVSHILFGVLQDFDKIKAMNHSGNLFE